VITPHYTARLLAVASVGLILAVTLFPIPVQQALVDQTPFWCLVCGDLGFADVVHNLALFMPLGLALRLSGSSAKQALVAAAVMSFSIELLQLLVIPGRDGTLSDILTNSTGAWIGARIPDIYPIVARPSPRAATRLLCVGVLGWFLGLAGTSFLLQPSPIAGPWYGKPAPTSPYYQQFLGEVLSVTLGQVPISPDLPQQPAAFVAGDPIRIALRSGPPPRGFVPIVIITTDRGVPFVTVGQRGTIVEASIRLRASAMRLRSPVVRMDAALPQQAGVTTVIGAGIENGILHLHNASQQARLPLRPSLGWALISPFRSTGGSWTVVALGMLWIGFSVLPLAYWAGGTRNPPFAIITMAAALGIGLGLLPAWFHLPATAWHEWVAVAASLALGTISGLHLRAFRNSRPAP
jgi:hypothetical protein